MTDELRDLLTRYAKDEQDNPEPTDRDLEESRLEGLDVFGSEQALLDSLKFWYGLT